MYKVLIVDDKALIRKGIISSIDWEALNIELVGEADNGTHALESIKLNKPDIVVTDIRMPDMDGIELLKNISESGSQIVTIVISGYDDFEYAKKAIKYGSIDYIMKPISPAELNESLRRAHSILNSSKVHTTTKEQSLRDLFLKSIKEVNVSNEEYRILYESYYLDESIFCVVILKGIEIDSEDIKSLRSDFINNCFIEASAGLTTVVFFTNKNSPSVNGFDLAMNLAAQKILARYQQNELILGIGQIVSNVDQIGVSYKSACEAVLSGMLPGTKKIINFLELQSRKIINFKLEDYEKQLIANVTSGNVNTSQQILRKFFDRILLTPDASIESLRKLYRDLCYILIKLNVCFESEIYEFLDRIGIPEYLLKYESIECLNQIVFNFYNFASEEQLDQIGGKNSAIVKVKSFIDRSFSEDISLSKLSELFHMNASYLTRVFKEKEGFSINEYITKVRVENAKRLLESGKLNMQKLADAVGYEDSTYFFKVFKKVTGMTPRAYILKIKNKAGAETE